MTVSVDSGSVIVAGGGATFDHVISKNGLVYDLVGKEVKATIRKKNAPSTVIHSTLEDIVVTLGGTVAAALGGVQFTLSAAQTEHLAPPSYLLADSVVPYIVQYYVVTDTYYPQYLTFGVRMKLN